MSESQYIPIAVRGYAVPVRARPQMPEKHAEEQLSPWTLAFDTETDTDSVAQALLYACYQVYKGRELFAAGIAYDEHELSRKEVETVTSFAVANRLQAGDLDEFRERVFYRFAYDLRATVIGANLFFDLSRLALDHTLAGRSMRGGFSLSITRNPSRPPVRMKKLAARASKFDFASRFKIKDGDEILDPWRGRFVDVLTAGNAILGGRYSLETLGDRLRVGHPKLETPDFARPITVDQLEYAVRDPLTTAECYFKLEDRYADLDLPTPLNHIYSEASISKAYLKKMGIQPWLRGSKG
jgi:hypothetical protein